MAFPECMASVRGVEATPLSFAAKQEGLLESMIREARLAIEEDGAQAIIGYGSLTLVKKLRKALPVPVINSVTAGILVAETLVIAQSS
jgi:Asp/Glu/hydantoin racemase